MVITPSSLPESYHLGTLGEVDHTSFLGTNCKQWIFLAHPEYELESSYYVSSETGRQNLPSLLAGAGLVSSYMDSERGPLYFVLCKWCFLSEPYFQQVGK